jgi:hypothetical protein
MGYTASDRGPRLGATGCAGTALLGLALCACLILGTCVSKVEVGKAASPDGRFTARVFEINGGATTDFAYEVDVARSGPVYWDHAVAGFYGAVRSDCAYGVNVRWSNSTTLLLTYKRAKAVDVDPSLRIGGEEVRIIVKGAVDDPEAPCGGMEYGQGG